MIAKTSARPAPKRGSVPAAMLIDWTRVTVLLGTIAVFFLVAHTRLTGQSLTWLLIAQYGVAIAGAAFAFALVPRSVRSRTPGYAAACAAGGFVALVLLAWMVEVDLSALIAPPAAAAETLGDVPLRNLASTGVRAAGPSLFREMTSAALAVDPVYLGMWAGVGAIGGSAYGWATRALRR